MWWRFPYTNFHELNLDWVIQKIKDFSNKIDNIDGTIKETVADSVQKLVDDGYFQNLVDEDVLNGVIGKVDLLTDKRVICLADSYGRYEYSWGLKLPGLIGASWWRHWYKSGCGFGRTTQNNTPATIINENISAISEDERKKVNMIIMGFGTNDISFLDTVDTGVSQTKAAIETYFPNATVYLGAIGNYSLNTGGDYTPANYAAMVKKYKDICINNGWVYIANSETAFIDPSGYLPDGVHPNEAGSTEIARHLAMYFNSKATDFQGFNVDLRDYIQETEGVTLDNVTMGVTEQNGVVTAGLNASGSITMNTNAATGFAFTIGTTKLPFFRCANTAFPFKAMKANAVFTLNGAAVNVPCSVETMGENVRIRCVLAGYSGQAITKINFYAAASGCWNYLC